jgi:molybdenum cofactor cytidylyltransferase
MGKANKLILEVEGTPLVRLVAETAVSAALDPIVVVLGHEAREVRGALEGLTLHFVVNAHPEEGLSSSIRTGLGHLESLEPSAPSALFMLGDMPWVQPSDIAALVAAFDPASRREICVPTHDGHRGNPVLWGARFFAEIGALRGDVGARQLMERYSAATLEVDVEGPGVLRDVDMPEALRAAKITPPVG